MDTIEKKNKKQKQKEKRTRPDQRRWSLCNKQLKCWDFQVFSDTNFRSSLTSLVVNTAGQRFGLKIAHTVTEEIIFLVCGSRRPQKEQRITQPTTVKTTIFYQNGPKSNAIYNNFFSLRSVKVSFLYKWNRSHESACFLMIIQNQNRKRWSDDI